MRRFRVYGFDMFAVFCQKNGVKAAEKEGWKDSLHTISIFH